MTEERRARVLTEQDLAALAEVMAASRPIADNIHIEHHQFISEWIAKSRQRSETIEKVKAQVGGWGIIVVLGGIGFAVWDWVKTHLR